MEETVPSEGVCATQVRGHPGRVIPTSQRELTSLLERAVADLVSESLPAEAAELCEERPLVVEDSETGFVIHAAGCAGVSGEYSAKRTRVSSEMLRLKEYLPSVHGCIQGGDRLREVWSYPVSGRVSCEEVCGEITLLCKVSRAVRAGQPATDLGLALEILESFERTRGGRTYEQVCGEMIEVLREAVQAVPCAELTARLQEGLPTSLVQPRREPRRRDQTDGERAVMLTTGERGLLVSLWAEQAVACGTGWFVELAAAEAKLLSQVGDWHGHAPWVAIEGGWLDEIGLRLISEQYQSGMERWRGQEGVVSHVLEQAVATAQAALAEIDA